jgi:hypothetical protein
MNVKSASLISLYVIQNNMKKNSSQGCLGLSMSS